MDGNGRWASARGLDVAEGHRAGSRALRPVVETAMDVGVASLAVYAFSTENWARSEDEVSALMEIFGDTIDRELHDLAQEGVHTQFVGRRDRAPDWLRDKMEELERATVAARRLHLWIAFDYGGRAEIVEAVKRIVADGISPEEVNETVISRYLYTADLPDPDLLIRTAGEMRLSNFLLWQAAYSEYYATPTLWPDFGESDLTAAIAAYSSRCRKFGKLA